MAQVISALSLCAQNLWAYLPLALNCIFTQGKGWYAPVTLYPIGNKAGKRNSALALFRRSRLGGGAFALPYKAKGGTDATHAEKLLRKGA